MYITPTVRTYINRVIYLDFLFQAQFATFFYKLSNSTFSTNRLCTSDREK